MATLGKFVVFDILSDAFKRAAVHDRAA